jgi:hypothetical protein
VSESGNDVIGGTTSSVLTAVQTTISLFVRLISHQPAVLFSHNKPATNNQP